ncbi:MAG TPA: hypothetical protein VFU20_00125 [Sphingomicrobium sp.]|nr:hypothetical protein [Sphingomicrobium sp.]
MKTLILLAGAALLASAGPALAKPNHAKHNKGQHARVLHDHRGHVGYGTGGCPPGLAKQNAECMPPGQHKKLFAVGQRVPSGYRGLLGYDALPYDLRSRYGTGLDPYSRYIYRDDYLYRVDPRTMVVSEILRAIL